MRTGARAAQVIVMLFYIALCFAATHAAGVGEPKPVFSPIYSMRIETDDHIAKHIWVDRVKNRTRTDFLNVEGQGVFELYNEELKNPAIHWIFPVTTEERMNVRKCFLGDSWYARQFIYTLFTLPPMTDFNFVGRERMHDEDASIWKASFTNPDPFYTNEWTIWVADRNGVSVPLRMYSNLIYAKVSYHRYVDIYDYDISDIDPEVWNIGAGMNCKLGLDSDVEENSNLINKMTVVMDDSNEFNLFDSFAVNFWHNKHSILGQMYKHTVDQFTDSSKEMGFIRSHGQTSNSRQSKALPFPYTAEEVERLSKDLPKQFDWRVYGAVEPADTPVQYKLTQYAFHAAQAVEAALFIHRGMKEWVVPLSAQAIIDCSWGFGNRGIEGGSTDGSFEWMMIHGIPTAASYPYKGDPDYCHIENVEIEAKVKAYHTIPRNDVNAFKLALINHGPVAVKFKYFEYSYGVYNRTDKCADYLILEALVVGYGVADDIEYWIMKTSLGYVYITTRDNACGIMDSATYVTIE